MCNKTTIILNRIKFIYNIGVIFMSRFKVTKTVPVGPVPTLEVAKATQRQIKSKLQGKDTSCKFTKVTKGRGGFKFKAISSIIITAESTVAELKRAIEAQTQVPGAKVSVVNLTAKAKRSNS
jgi:hypothetical protein